MSGLVKIYTDGGCSPNPGRGGWGCVLLYGDKVGEDCGGEDNTTNNPMEITAVIQGLRLLKRACQVEVYTDSQYVIGVMTQGWKRKSNADLLSELDELARQHEIEFVWVQGHAGNEWNEKAHQLTEKGRRG